MKATYTQRPTADLTSFVTNRHAPHITHGKTVGRAGAIRDRQAEARLMTAYGILFDGNDYWFGPFRYQRLDDALVYARMNRVEPSIHEQEGGLRPWRTPEAPDEPTRQLMDELGITFDGRRYRYGIYRYDQFVDAINYAQSTSDQGGSTPRG